MLMIHLPLNGDLHNQGLANIEVTNNGATVDNNGKIGKCYSFDGTSKYISLTNPLTDASEISCSVWVKPLANTSTNGQIINIGTNSSWTNIRFGILQRTTNQFIFHVSDGTNQINYACASGTIALNEWINIICTYKERTLKMYLNGELVKTHSISFDPSFSGISNIGIGAAPNGSEKFTGCINDVRIFTHCLSLKEISELKKLLILHYPLDNNGVGGENLLKNSNFLQGTNGMQGYTATMATCTKQTDCMKVVSTSASGGFYTPNYNSITTGDMTTFSADVKADNSMTIYIGTDGSGNGNCQAYTVGTSWQRISISKAKTTNNAILRIYGNGTFYTKLLKYELGSKPTPWCPNSSDELATTIGINDGIEYDTSGFGNNGTRVGEFSWSTDTPRYLSSTVFDTDISKYIKDVYAIKGLTMNEITVSLWFNTSSSSESVSGDGENLFSFAYNSGLRARIPKNSTNTIWLYDGTAYTFASNTSFVDGKWHLLVITFDNGIYKCFIDGIQIDSNKTKSTSTITFADNEYYRIATSQIGGEHFVGSLSDFRIYATALSAEDIQKLYSVSALIDSQGNAFASSYVEG